MKPHNPYMQEEGPDTGEGEAGLYDAVPAEDDLWFLPGPDPEAVAFGSRFQLKRLAET